MAGQYELACQTQVPGSSSMPTYRNYTLGYKTATITWTAGLADNNVNPPGKGCCSCPQQACGSAKGRLSLNTFIYSMSHGVLGLRKMYKARNMLNNADMMTGKQCNTHVNFITACPMLRAVLIISID